MEETWEECVVDTVRFFDSETKQYGYSVACVRTDEHECEAGERELFRLPPMTLAYDA